MNTQEEYETLKKQNRRRLIGAVVVVLLAVIVLMLVLNKKDHNGIDQDPNTQDINVVGGTGSQTVVLPNPIASDDSASDVLPDDGEQDAVPVLPDDVAVDMPTMAPIVSEPLIKTEPEQSTAPVAPPQEKPKRVVEPIKPIQPPSSKPAEVAKPKEKQAAKLTPKEILEGKAGQSFSAVAPERQVSTTAKTAIIQVGAFTDPLQAEQLKNRLKQGGIQAKLYQVQTAKGQVIRVRVGPFKNRAEAQTTLNKINQLGVDGIIVNP